jgi:hypothetical protein
MDFNEVSKSYAALQQQLASGAIAPELYQQEVAKLRFVTSDGVWWQVDPATGGWLTWDGQSWVPPATRSESLQPLAGGAVVGLPPNSSQHHRPCGSSAS